MPSFHVYTHLLQDELDEVAKVWDGHLIRKSKQGHVTQGRPLLMFQLPEVYEARSHLKRVEQELTYAEGNAISRIDFHVIGIYLSTVVNQSSPKYTYFV